LVERGHHVAAHLQHEHRQGQQRGKHDASARRASLLVDVHVRVSVCMPGVRVVIRVVAGRDGQFVARRLERLARTARVEAVADVEAGHARGEVDPRRRHARHRRKRALHPRHAGPAAHAFHGQLDGLARSVHRCSPGERGAIVHLPIVGRSSAPAAGRRRVAVG
jgi:hypothetical protein